MILMSITTLQIQGCKKDSENVDSTTIEGTWKLVGQNLGLPDGYIKVTDGELFTLNNDSTFKKGTDKCNEGVYSITENVITLDYSCEIKKSMLSDGIQEWGYSLKNGTLRISPKFLNCDEGCTYEYEKISNN
ncbi:MAG: lipocalin family protein [Sphingobacterium sp.]